MTKFILILLTAFAFTAFGQTDKEQEYEYEYGMKAIEEMEAGNSDVALKLLKKLAPNDINYPYEMAYAHYLPTDYGAN